MTMSASEQPTYEAVARLSPDEQRSLLRTASPVERLWAAWALGQRVGAAALPDIQGALEAPLPGLRAHLAIVLAGLGERELVETLVLHDPDALVRVAAGQHLVRTAPPGQDVATDPSVKQLLHDPAADVRFAVLRELLRRAALQQVPALSSAELERLSADPDAAVRRLALDTLDADPGDAALCQLYERRLETEPDSEIRRWLAARVISAGRGRAVLGLVGGDGSELDDDLLRSLEDHGEQFTWDEIAALARVGQPGLDVHLTKLLAPG